MTKWLDVKEHPLPISKEYHSNAVQCFDSNKEDILVFVTHPQGDFITVTTLFYRLESVYTFKLSDTIDATYPFDIKLLDRITHWMPLFPPSNKDDNYV